MATRTKTTTQRGLGWNHQKTRTHLLTHHHDGKPCWWCGLPMYREPERNWDNAPLEADHETSRDHGGHKANRLLHMTCNRQRGNGDRDHLRPTLTGVPVQLSAAARAITELPLDRRIMNWPW